MRGLCSKGKDMIDIDVMEAGPEFDALIAEMRGWTAWRERRGDYHLAITSRPGEKPWEKVRYDAREQERERYTKITCVEAVKIGFYGRGFPAATTDRPAAWEVVTKGTPGGSLSFSLHRFHSAAGTNHEWRAECGHITATAPTAPLAICRAALKAVRGGS